MCGQSGGCSHGGRLRRLAAWLACFFWGDAMNKRICDCCGKPEMHLPVNSVGSWIEYLGDDWIRLRGRNGEKRKVCRAWRGIEGYVHHRVWLEKVCWLDGTSALLCHWCRKHEAKAIATINDRITSNDGDEQMVFL